MYQEKINAYFDALEPELAAAAARLMRIRSVTGPAEPGKPFGPGIAACLEEALTMARAYGLSAHNYEGYVGLIDLNDKPDGLHILAHLDVVGEGTGWTITEPYEPLVQDGLLYGRGALDDKGPAVAALLAMRAVKDLGVPLSQNVRLILGTDEESGSSDIHYYYARNPHAPYAFSPDGEFPVINTEKGLYRPAFQAEWSPETVGPRVSSLTGGFRLNVVPPEAEAVVEGLSPLELSAHADSFEGATGAHLTVTPRENGVLLHVKGVGGHASFPQAAVNALTALLGLLARLPLADCAGARAVRALAELFPHGDYHGKGLGIAQSDDISGPLTAVLSLLTLTATGLDGRVDSRTALCANDENCRLVAEASFAARGIICTGDMAPAHHVPADSPFVQTLLRAYEQYTGQPGACLSMGGATYVHDIPGGVCFGPNMPGFVSNIHGPDESANLRDLITSAKIFTQAIIDLCARAE